MITRAVISTRYSKGGYTPKETTNVEAYMLDGAMDTDTDTWTLRIGDVDRDFIDVLGRDNEVRVQVFSINDARVEALHSGFADEITLNEDAELEFSGRDITAVAVDSQHPPQVWRGIRPRSLVAREARALQIGDKLKLSDAASFKVYGTDGSESYWQVWYRFYRKRRMWLWAEPDGTLNGATLNYAQKISYSFGAPPSSARSGASNYIPVIACEWRANKSQRVGEVYVFGHRGDVGFVAHAKDPSTTKWIKKPTVITQSSDVHNAAEARVEAWEEIFESKVGATEIKLTVPAPAFAIRQNKMARVNLPEIGLKGDFFVVGVQMLGELQQGHYCVVRLREQNYAISRRVPTDPQLQQGAAISGDQGSGSQGSTIASALTGVRWKEFFVEGAQKYRGPWSFELFLGVLLSICEQETGFANVRRGSHLEYPGGDHLPSIVAENAAYQKFAQNFANVAALGRVREDYAVGPMQLLTLGYKLYADRLDEPARVGDELLGGRWNPRTNILAGAAALASKLGAGFTINAAGEGTSVKPFGLSLNPTEANMWAGVAAYGEGAQYAREVKDRYTSTYQAEVDTAIKQAARDSSGKADAGTVPGGSIAELRKRVLDNKLITYTRASQQEDIRLGLIDSRVLIVLLFLTEGQGYPLVITALKSDHTKFVSGSGRISDHWYGRAVDLGNYGRTNPKHTQVQELLRRYQLQLGLTQEIGPDDNLVIPLGLYDAATLAAHETHIHVGFSA